MPVRSGRCETARMKKKITAAALVAVLLLALMPIISTSAGAAGLNFISVNDTLIDYAYAYYSGSNVYVPASLFSYFGVSYSYFQEAKTASLMTNATQIYFELESGNTYDAAENYYSAQAYYLYGTVYVPVAFVCRTFGLSWSTVTGSSYGSIVRIKNSAVVLSDEQFLSAASDSMRAMYNAYYGIVSPSPSSPADASDRPSGGPDTSPAPVPDRSATSVYLCFAGLPDEQIVKALSSHGYDAAFFLTAEQVTENADAVRALIVEGFAVGVWFEDEAGYAEAYGAILERTHTATLLVASDGENAEGCRRFAEENSLVYWQCAAAVSPEKDDEKISSPAAFISLIEPEPVRADVLIKLEETELSAVTQLLKYLALNKFTVAPVRETTAPEVSLSDAE